MLYVPKHYLTHVTSLVQIEHTVVPPSELQSDQPGQRTNHIYAPLVEGQVQVDCSSSRSTTMSLVSFSRKGRPFLKVGNCSFIVSKPATLMSGTGRPPSSAASSANEPGGNRQSDHRPAGDA